MFYLEHKDNDLWYGKFSIFPEDKVIHGISTKFNGVSTGDCKGLNLALHVQDNPEDVVTNRQKFCEGLGLDAKYMTTCQQVHSNHIEFVTEENIGAGATAFDNTIKDTDALITSLHQVPLTLFFADCTPIMIYDTAKNIIAVAHGGWRGTAGQISYFVIKAMEKKFHTRPKDCVASIGPSIGPCCYEIGDEVADVFKDVFKDESHYILSRNQKTHKYHLDLWTANALTLLKACVPAENIDMANTCTCCNSDVFYSYRADNGKTGRIAATIALK